MRSHNKPNDTDKNEHGQTVDETAVTETTAPEEENKQSRQSFMKRFSGFLDTAKGGMDTINEFYTSWIKPIYDNRAQISRRLNAVSTAISIIFFILYVPFLLFGKLYKDLTLGWDIAMYVCIGVYLATLFALFIVTLASGKSTTTTMANRHKKTRKIVLFIVRIASLAIAITALVISAVNGTKDAKGATLDTISIVFAVMSIIFSALPLVFGGLAGFLRWLISPAKVKYKFSMVLLEWYQGLTSEKQINKVIKKATKKYGERIGHLIDDYFIPQLGKKKITAIDRPALAKVLESVPAEDLNLSQWTVKEVFEYAEECGYITINPCTDMGLEGDIELEGKQKKTPPAEEKRAKGKLSKLFSKKKKTEE